MLNAKFGSHPLKSCETMTGKYDVADQAEIFHPAVRHEFSQARAYVLRQNVALLREQSVVEVQAEILSAIGQRLIKVDLFEPLGDQIGKK